MNETTWLIADIDIAEVSRALSAARAATVPGILRDQARHRLLQEARVFPFIAGPAVVKPYGVRQRYAMMTSFPPGSDFRALREAFQALLKRPISPLSSAVFSAGWELRHFSTQLGFPARSSD